MMVGEKHRSCQKHESLSLHDLLCIGRHFLGDSFITSMKSNSCRALTTQKITLIISHAQNTTAVQPNVFLTGKHWSRVTGKGGSAFHSANACQGQLQTPQSLSVPDLSKEHSASIFKGLEVQKE
jgi:hypothetical protein